MKSSVSIVGLGYIGLPLACLCAEKNIDTYGIDIDKNKISLIKQGISPIDDPDLRDSVKKIKEILKVTSRFEEAIKNSNIIIVCVPTPIDDDHLPDLNPLKNACESISTNMQNDCLIIIESTIYPGTMEEIITGIFKKSNVNFYLAHCPERIDPGNKSFTIKNLPRVVAGINSESTKKAVEFYTKKLLMPK